jgi:integrase
MLSGRRSNKSDSPISCKSSVHNSALCVFNYSRNPDQTSFFRFGYDTRHTFVSNLLRDGADIKATSQLIGHTRVQTPLDVYKHVHTGAHRAAVKKA